MAVAIGLAGSGLLVFYYIGIMSIFSQQGKHWGGLYPTAAAGSC